MPGDIATLLLGVQGGDEESFACLYAVTNPVLVRYLRVVSDADPASLALATWSTLVHRMLVCVADDDDDWLELAVSTARESALASATIRSSATPVPDGTPSVPAPTGSKPEPDPIDEGVAELRACGPAVADVLAMGVVAGLGRDSIARITGQEPIEVLALVLDGQTRLDLPLESLIGTMRVPGTPGEGGDLPAVLSLFAAQSHSPLPTASTAASASTPTVVDLLTWGAPARATSRVVLSRRAQADVSPRWARIGASAAAWTVAAGGVAAAAAINGVIPAAIHNLFGDQSNRPTIAAHGPIRPGEVPSQTDRGLGTRPRSSGGQPSQQRPVVPATGPVGQIASGDGVVVSASSAGFATATQLLVVSAVLTDSSSSPVSAPTTPSRPGATLPKPTPQPPSTGTGTVTSAGHAHRKGSLKHSTRLAKSRAKAPRPAAKAQAASARARAAAAAKARSAAQAQAKPKAKAAKSPA